jgi:hypothetical protein
LGQVFVQKPVLPPDGPTRQNNPVGHASVAPTVQGAPNEAVRSTAASTVAASELLASSTAASFGAADGDGAGVAVDEHANRNAKDDKRGATRVMRVRYLIDARRAVFLATFRRRSVTRVMALYRS